MNFGQLDLIKSGNANVITCNEMGSGVSEFEVPNGATEIEEYEFSCFKSLTKITIPNTVTKIGESAFSFCESLKNIRRQD